MTQICEDCRYFIQHYRRRKNGYSKVGCGHCFHPRIKHRKPDTPACKHYEKKTDALL